MFTNNPATYGEETEISCKFNGFPKPNFNITYNSTTNIVKTGKTLTISPVKWSDAGTYTCIAWNELGSDSASDDLIVEGKVTF